MPYTPPTQRSPATSKPNSPILSRNHSYSEQHPPLPVKNQRPALPRSVSSTSYLNKHRRSPSISTTNNTAANGQVAHGSVVPAHAAQRGHGPSANGSIRQSPPPLNDLLIPSGAITTPPDSSDDDDERGRSIGNLKELQEALQHIDVKREPSPNRDGAADTPANSLASITPPPRPLSADARKISHSRSSSEITLSQHMPPLDTQPLISSSDGSDVEDDELRIKPPLLRKKSGELVKPALRPPSRRRPSSMPGTPTYSKAVHFNEDIEQVRHFLQVDRPIAVSAGSSPVETYDSESEYPFHDDQRSRVPEWEIKLANFPSETYERQTMPVRVERIFLASDNKTLVGTVACANIAFHKFVVARFTLDYWKTTSEIVAEYNHDVRKKQKDDGYDRFNFNIKLADQANLASKTLLLCVRYNVNGQEYWDNNGSMNYQIDFIKKTKQRSKGQGAGTLGAIPRSRHSPPAPRPRSMPVGSFDDDFGHSLDNSKFQFGSNGRIIGDSPSSSIRLKPKPKRGSLFPDQAPHRQTGGQAFSTRYDFGASLSAALSNAQTAMGTRTSMKPSNTEKGPSGYFDRTAPTSKSSSNAAPIPGTRPDTLSSEKPPLQSAEYNELIQKFCFFGTPTGKGSPKATTPAAKESHPDGAMEYSSGSNQSSASNSPPSPVMPVLVDGANDSKPASRSQNHFLSRSASPGPMTGSGPEDRVNFQYGYNMHGGIFPEPNHTAQACV